MILVDSNVLLDVITNDSVWQEWSSSQLQHLANTSILVINPIIYAEISIDFATPEEVETALSSTLFKKEHLPFEACFLAGKVFTAYKRQGGHKGSPLPDFFIGAHAAVRQYSVLTRDIKRYKTYFPSVPLISPHH